jgi:hypothetical protein
MRRWSEVGSTVGSFCVALSHVVVSHRALFGAALFGVTVGSLACNTLEPREIPAGGAERARCVNQCLDEHEPKPVDCAAAEEGVEFYPIPVWNFQRPASNANASPKASNLYMYADGSQEFIRSIKRRHPETGELEWFEQAAANDHWRKTFGFEPDVRTDVARCIGEDPATRGVLHVQGGPFRAWGGAVGRHLKCINSKGNDIYPSDAFTITAEASGTPQGMNKGCGQAALDAVANQEACAPAANDDPVALLRRSACPARDQSEEFSPEERFLRGMTLDLTQWEGISFWARRSKDGQPGIRVALGDKHTDDDLSYLQYHLNPESPRFCERNQECGCPGGAECVDGYCYDPRVEPPPNAEPTAAEKYGYSFLQPEEETDRRYAPCGQYMCARGFPAFRTPGGSEPREDVAFAGTVCEEYTFRGGITDYHCLDPESGRMPHENSRLCGDHWLKSVQLSTEWRFYKIPFTDLTQQGWAKEAYEIDLTTAAVVRFIWGRGWVDMMLDDVRFYRHKNTKG